MRLKIPTFEEQRHPFCQGSEAKSWYLVTGFFYAWQDLSGKGSVLGAKLLYLYIQKSYLWPGQRAAQTSKAG